MKVLVTCGPTWVPIDTVRVLSNQSTGAMGHLIAQEFNKAGAKVTLIEGPVSDCLKTSGIKVIKYAFFEELLKTLMGECVKKYDIIAHAAAVSDFKPPQVFKGKIGSDKILNLRLIPTEKIINKIKALSPASLLVGFKLVSHFDISHALEAAERLFIESKCNLVVVNSINKGYRGCILNAQGHVLAKASHRSHVAQFLVKIFNGI